MSIGLLIVGCYSTPSPKGEASILGQAETSFPRPRGQESAGNRISLRRDKSRASDTILVRLRQAVGNRQEFGLILEELAADAEPGSYVAYKPGKLPAVGDELSDDAKKEIMNLLEKETRDYSPNKSYDYLGYYATFSARLVGQEAVPYLQRLTRDYVRSWRSQLRKNAGEDFGLLVAQRIALGDVENAVKDWEQILNFSDENVDVRHLRPAWEFPDDPVVQTAVAAKLGAVEENGISYNAARRLIPLVFASEEAQPLFKSKAVREYLIRQLNKTERVGTLTYVAPKGKLTVETATTQVLKYKVGLFRGSFALSGLNSRSEERSTSISIADITLQEISPGFTRNNPMNGQEFRREEIRLNAIKRLEKGDVLDLPSNVKSHMAIYRPEK